MVFGLKDDELALQNENDDLNDRASLTNLVDKRLTDINQDSKSNEVVKQLLAVIDKVGAQIRKSVYQ